MGPSVLPLDPPPSPDGPVPPGLPLPQAGLALISVLEVVTPVLQRVGDETWGGYCREMGLSETR